MPDKFENHIYDVAIAGGGPAGYTAALYATRAGLDAVVIEKLSAGGQMCQTLQIDNYPGFEEGIDGFTLGFKMQQCAERFGAKTIQAEILDADLKENVKILKTDGEIIKAKSVIIATGAEHRQLGIENEEMLIGRGVGYCATCDGMFYRGKTVAVVGGGNSAAADAIYLSKICEKVILIHRRDKLRATKIYHEPLLKAKNVEFCWNSNVCQLLYNETLTGVKVIDNNGNEKEIACEGLFISIGRTPETDIFKGLVSLDENGYIIADESTRTNIPGVFAAGDVRTKELRQVITAASDGAVAAHYAEKYISQK